MQKGTEWCWPKTAPSKTRIFIVEFSGFWVKLRPNLLKIWLRISFHDVDLGGLQRALSWMLCLSRRCASNDLHSKTRQKIVIKIPGVVLCKSQRVSPCAAELDETAKSCPRCQGHNRVVPCTTGAASSDTGPSEALLGPFYSAAEMVQKMCLLCSLSVLVDGREIRGLFADQFFRSKHRDLKPSLTLLFWNHSEWLFFLDSHHRTKNRTHVCWTME